MKYEEMKALIGKRVEIPVHYDLWMQGARLGKVTGRRDGKDGQSACLLVKMDHPQIRKRLRVWALDVEYMKLI